MNLEIIDKNNYKDVIKSVIDNDINTLIIFQDEDIERLEEMSWIWDTNFFDLNRVDKIFCCGKRNKDIFFKLKLDNLCENIYVEDDFHLLLKKLEKENYKIIGSMFSINKLNNMINK